MISKVGQKVEAFKVSKFTIVPNHHRRQTYKGHVKYFRIPSLNKDEAFLKAGFNMRYGDSVRTAQ